MIADIVLPPTGAGEGCRGGVLLICAEPGCRLEWNTQPALPERERGEVAEGVRMLIEGASGK